MHNKKIWIAVALIAVALAAALAAYFLLHLSAPPEPSQFLRVSGGKILKPDGTEFRIRATSKFHLIDDSSIPDDIDEIYARAASYGFNAVRLSIEYPTFEDDDAPFTYKESGFEWLEANFRAAKNNGMYLILAMHHPQGGIQSGTLGASLWLDEENQDRLVSLWQAIAARCALYDNLIGYGLLGEPRLVAGADGVADGADWQALAQRIATAIRKSDPSHILFVERVNGAVDRAGQTAALDPVTQSNLGFVKIEDDNMMAEFHFYEPFQFTHQPATLDPNDIPAHLLYPNAFVSAKGTKWLSTNRSDNPKADPFSEEWQFLLGGLTQPPDGARIASVLLDTRAIFSGSALYDDIIVKEYDRDGTEIRTVLDLSMRNDAVFYLWSEDKRGTLSYTDGLGRDGAGCVVVTGTTTQDSAATLYGGEFTVEPDHFYQISASVKGIALPPDAFVGVRLDFSSADAVQSYDSNYIKKELDSYLSAAQRLGMPAFVGEFGTNIYSFDKGAEAWLADMFQLLEERGLSYVFFELENPYFGPVTDLLPNSDEVNLRFSDLLRKWVGGGQENEPSTRKGTE